MFSIVCLAAAALFAQPSAPAPITIAQAVDDALRFIPRSP